MYRKDDWLSFEDMESIKARGNLIQKYGLAGARLYGFDQDDFDNRCKSECAFPLTRTIKSAVGIVVDCSFKSKTGVILLNASKSSAIRPMLDKNAKTAELTSGAREIHLNFYVIMFFVLTVLENHSG